MGLQDPSEAQALAQCHYSAGQHSVTTVQGMGLQGPSEVQVLAQCHYSARHGTAGPL